MEMHPQILQRLVDQYVKVWKEQGELAARAWASRMFQTVPERTQFLKEVNRRNSQ